jgi:dihydroorotase-like cyclic amidohydrolase
MASDLPRQRGRFARPGSVHDADLASAGGVSPPLFSPALSAKPVFASSRGSPRSPGVIDAQVHVRNHGQTH